MLQLRAHVILCFRAEEKIEIVKEGGKTVVRPKQSMTGKDGWIPVCEKSLPFELTASFLMLATQPGVPQPIKLQQQHRHLFPDGGYIDESAGKRIAEWASGSPAQSRLPAILDRLRARGVTDDAIAKRLGHAPTDDDIPALTAFGVSLAEAAKAPPVAASEPPVVTGTF